MICELEAMEADPLVKLNHIATVVTQSNSANLDWAIRVLARSDEAARKIVQRVGQKREAYACELLAQAGFKLEDAKLRASLFVAFLIGIANRELSERDFSEAFVLDALNVVFR